MPSLKDSPLGKHSEYPSQYQPELLFPIARSNQREKIGLLDKLPFKGVDVWNAYEISWLNTKGKPVVAIAEFILPCDSPFMIESKSFKLYLNSFNNAKFATLQEVAELMHQDLSKAARANVSVKLIPIHQSAKEILAGFEGTCLDHLDIECDTYLVNPQLLHTENIVTSEVLYSDLLKSNCLITGQPDWGSIQISYTGKKIQHEDLLRYIISFRHHNEFHEHCVERIFMDIMQHCQPEKLTVHARYVRRGGLDINPYRSTENNSPEKHIRLSRQ